MSNFLEIQMKPIDYRPCYVGDKKAFFHQWATFSHIVPPSFMVGGLPGGVESYVAGIVELEDGSIKQYLPENIKFVDSIFKESAFPKNK